MLDNSQGHNWRLLVLGGKRCGGSIIKNYPNLSCLETLCPLVTLLEGFWSKTTPVMGHTQERVLRGPRRGSLRIWDSVAQCPAPDNLKGCCSRHPVGATDSLAITVEESHLGLGYLICK